MPTPALTPEIIAAHERLYPRLAALLKQVERVAARRPGAEVTEETGRLARELCREAAKLLGRDGRGIGLPKPVAGAPLDHGGLAIHLGQALAGLEQFEALHSLYVHQHHAVCWQLPGGAFVPVSRLKPRVPPKGVTGASLAEQKGLARDKPRIVQRIIKRENFIYLEGYADGKAGRPPRKPTDDFRPVP